MKTAEKGDKVKVNYTGKFLDGTIFDTTAKRNPFEFIIGAGEVIIGFDEALLGMKVGEIKNVMIDPADAYGTYNTDLTLEVNLHDFPEGEKPELGAEVEVTGKDGGHILMSVIDISGDKVTLDANHPLAGQSLSFEIELLEFL